MHFAPVTLSSVRHDLEGMAGEAAALLERLMSGRRPPRAVVRIPPKGGGRLQRVPS
jgi:DNA-binding LacI/PurR family transcriptional regulator